MKKGESAPGAPCRRARWIQWLAQGGAALVILLSVLSARMLISASAQVQLADQAQKAGDAQAVDRHLRRAMTHYIPFNPWVEHACRRLLARAQQADKRKLEALALRRYHALRSAILRLRGATSPYSEFLPRINARIVALSASHPGAAAHLKTVRARRAHAKLLMTPPAPNPWWAAIGLIGFLTWTTSGFLLAYFGLSNQLSPTKHLASTLLGIGAGFGLFALGMGLA
jgi:hypothetical protein